jgi:hypothetical protein
VAGAGTTIGPDGLKVTFRFWVTFAGNRGNVLWQGSSWAPDWYRITTGDKVLFEGEVQTPRNREDSVGWTRYGVFSAVRDLAIGAALAEYATGRRTPSEP